MAIWDVLKRETKVALSLRAQPAWFRIVKWVVFLVAGSLLWRSTYFWYYVSGALVLAVALHLVWRWKTGGWTRPWGGWNDLDAGR